MPWPIMSDIAIRTVGLGKAFQLRQRQVENRVTDAFVNSVRSLWRGQHTKEEFWALRDANIEIRHGEIVGLVGLNGAGKSTLLKLLSQITYPTTGRIELQGRVGSLLEVGTGFHPELSGRENIFLNGAILGMTRREIQNKFDEIVAFAEADKFLDMPVKRYSSGMAVRLAFAVAAHLEPEIMLVDEVLAVGDVPFQKKCLGQIRDMSTNSGRTIILVSHNPSALASLCHRGILLQHGEIRYDGGIQEALKQYKEETSGNKVTWEGPSGDEYLQLMRAWVYPSNADRTWDTGQEIVIGAELDVLQPVDGMVLGLRLLSEYGDKMVYTLYDDKETTPPSIVHPCRIKQTWKIPKNTLSPGRYYVSFEVGLANKKVSHLNLQGDLDFEVQNVTGIGQRFPVGIGHGFTSILRPDWTDQREVYERPSGNQK